MTPAEAQILLSMAATVDNRKPDEDAAKAWAAMLDGVRFEDCRVAVVEHYKGSSEWLMPSKIRADVKRIREKRLAETPEPSPPDGLSATEYVKWLRQERAAIADGNPPPPMPALDARPRDMRPLRDTFKEVGT